MGMTNDMDIRFNFLEDSDAQEIYRLHPELEAGICPTCTGRGEYKWAGKIWQCDCELQLQLIKHYLHAGIGVTFQRLDFSDLHTSDEEQKIVYSYLQNADQWVARGVGLLFHGDFGVGKTLTANLILKGLVRLGFRCYATTFPSLVDMYAGGWRDSLDRQRFETRVKGSQVLLVDDLGKEFATKTNLASTVFDNVLRSRVQSGLATFVTTNINPDALAATYGRATASLLKEASLEQEFKGPDYRSEAANRLRRELEAGEIRPVF